MIDKAVAAGRAMLAAAAFSTTCLSVYPVTAADGWDAKVKAANKRVGPRIHTAVRSE